MDPHANQLVTCPFNMAHQVEHYRIQVHLAKCQKQYPNMRIVTCPFDATHFVKAEELNHHVTTCFKREMLDTQLYVTDDDHRPVVQVQMNPVDFSCSENWDEDNAETYKPREAKKDAPIYSKIQGATKSERSKYRFDSSIRYAQAQARNNRAESAASDKRSDSAASNMRPDSAASNKRPDSAASYKRSDSKASNKRPDSAASNGKFEIN